jgi:hypothetical protein
VCVETYHTLAVPEAGAGMAKRAAYAVKPPTNSFSWLLG